MSTIGHASLSSLFDSKNLLNIASKNIRDPIDDLPAPSGDFGLKLNPHKFARLATFLASSKKPSFPLLASISDSSFTIKNPKNSPLDIDELDGLEKKC